MGETCVDVSGDAANATESMPAIACAGFTGNANDDVWFKFIATTPFPTIQVTSTTDLVLELLESDQMTNVDCSDGFGGGETLDISTAGVITPGMEYYVRVYSYGTGPFTYDVCVFDELPAPAAGSAACTATGMAMSTGSGLWLNLFDGDDLVASFKDDEAMGEVNCSYHVDPTGVREDVSATPIAFLDVDYQITVATQPTGDIPIRVYFSDAEFAELAAASSTVGTTGDLNVTHVPGGACTTGDFDNQGITQVLIGQSGNGTVTGGSYVEFETPSFSAFFLHGGNSALQSVALPLDLISLEVRAKQAGNMVSWTTANEINISHIEVQKSDRANGQWSTIGKLKPTGDRENSYEYMDESPYAVTYYRLNTVDLDGSNEISKVVSAVRKGDNRLTVFPNPATSKLSIQTASSETGSAIYNLYDLTGKVVLTQKVNLDNGQNQIDIDISTLQSGVYMLQFATASEIYTERIVKN